VTIFCETQTRPAVPGVYFGEGGEKVEKIFDYI